ncbi:MAG: nitroreductase family protein, partial [Burkholderiales bacterium]
HESLEYLEMLLMSTIDATLASQNAAVAAESLGLGVVYVGAIRNNTELVAKELGLPPKCFAAFGMCIGHPDPARPAAIKPRLPQSAVLHRETYDDGAIHETIDGYNATMDDFYREQNMKPLGPWDLHSLNRVRGVDALQGRERLVEILKSFGFGLR